MLTAPTVATRGVARFSVSRHGTQPLHASKAPNMTSLRPRASTRLPRLPQRRYGVAVAASSSSDDDLSSTGSKSKLPGWREARKELMELGARSVNPSRAQEMASEEGFVVVDVRREYSFLANHIKGSINVPLFSAKPDKLTFKLLAFLLLPSIKGTEFNSSFADEVMEKVKSKDSPILLVCDQGGDLEPTELSPEGARSSSLLAMWLLVNAGFTRVVHVRGGFRPAPIRPAAGSSSSPEPEGSAWLLKLFFPDAEYGMYSEQLMAVAFAIPILVLAILAYPRLVELYSDYAYGLMN